MKKSDEKQIYERQPGESKRSFALFLQWLREERPRSVKTFAKKVGKPEGTIWRLHSTKNWGERTDIWDRAQDKAEHKAILSERERIVRRHLRAIEKLHRLGEQNLDILLSHLEQEGVELKGKNLSPRDVREILKTSTELERLIIGEATERVETQWDLSKLSVEELQTHKELKEKAKKET